MLPSSSSYSNGYLGNGSSSEKRLNTSTKDRFKRGGGGIRVPSNKETPPPPCTEFDKAYFQSYSHVGIHEEMIKDRIRTDTYKAAIEQHHASIEGKVVVDVGCGTGILSIFCALAGAKRVYAIDASEIAIQANEVVKANKLSHKVIVLHGRVELLGSAVTPFVWQKPSVKIGYLRLIDSIISEHTPLINTGNTDLLIIENLRLDVEIPEGVDVIISEWMGYMLLYESMLGSVITARDRWLKPGGLILPSHATLYMAPVTHCDRYSESIDFWKNVYGIDMSAMLPLAKQCAFEEPSIETITGENVLTWPFVIKHVDCYTVTIQELESITARYRFTSMMQAPFHGFAFWFDVEFSGPAIFPSNNHTQPLVGAAASSDIPSPGSSQSKKRAKCNEALVLSTAPEEPPTHWQQTLLYFYEPIDVKQDQVIEGSVTMSQSKENARFLNLHLEYSSGGRSFVKESVLR